MLIQDFKDIIVTTVIFVEQTYRFYIFVNINILIFDYELGFLAGNFANPD